MDDFIFEYFFTKIPTLPNIPAALVYRGARLKTIEFQNLQNYKDDCLLKTVSD